MSARTQRLAQPKPNRLTHPDRRSVYWLDELPPARTESTTKVELTPRWMDLCGSKKFYTQVIRSPAWEVTRGALKAVASDRVRHLAQPRPMAAGWQPDRLLLAPLHKPTQTAVASPRLCQLAEPKRKLPVDVSKLRQNDPKRCQATAHIELLATPKAEHPKFEGERSVCWPVSAAARNYETSRRLRELSSPKERKALFEGYDPYAVSRAALSACPSPRIQQLSTPVPRKCSSNGRKEVKSLQRADGSPFLHSC